MITWTPFTPDHVESDEGWRQGWGVDRCPCSPDGQHQWEKVWSTNFPGTAYRCRRCWDRTD